MKKVLIILCCVVLLLPAAALSAFAEDAPYTLVFHNGYSQNHGSPCILIFERREYGSSDSYVSWQTLSVAESQTGSIALVVGYEYRFYVRFGTSSVYPIPSLRVNNSAYSSDTFVWDNQSDALDIYVYNSSDTSPVYRYVSVPAADPYCDLGVNDGVDSSISYTGQILTFLSTNTTTLVLIGLSVAMFAVLPFAISKIKQIIKGY